MIRTRKYIVINAMGPFCKAAGIYDVPITDPHENIAWQMVNYQLWW